MIAGTFATSGLLLMLTGWLFAQDVLSAFSQVALWTVIFFCVARRQLCVPDGERGLPLEIRALAIAVFYATGTAIGGIVAPWFFGALIDSGSRSMLFLGYAVAAILMLAAAVFEVTLGVAAERVSLERVAAPLSSAD